MNVLNNKLFLWVSGKKNKREVVEVRRIQSENARHNLKENGGELLCSKCYDLRRWRLVMTGQPNQNKG